MANAVANALASFGAMPNPAAAFARPRLAYGFGQTIHRDFEMTVERFGNAHTPSYAREDPAAP